MKKIDANFFHPTDIQDNIFGCYDIIYLIYKMHTINTKNIKYLLEN